MDLKLSKYVLFSEPLDTNNGPTGKRIIFSTRKSMGISVTNYVVDLVKASNFAILPNNLFNILMFHEIVVPEDQIETEEILKLKGLTGEDEFDIHQHLHIDIGCLQSNSENRINNLLEHFVPIKTTKKLIVHFYALSIKFSFNKTNLNKIKEIIESSPKSKNVDLEFKLICGIPIDNSLIDNDLSWIENIQIIYLANEDSLSFKASVSKIKSFSENVKLKTKLNVRIILGNNFKQLIEKGYESIKSIKHSILRFSLKKGNYSDCTYWNKKEAELLEILKTFEIHCVQIPEISNRFLDKTFIYNSKFHYEYFEDYLLKINEGKISIIKKNNYTSKNIGSIKISAPECFSCLFLPMCGGMINKSDTTNQDCPDFKSNIMEKARIKYKI